MISLLLPRLLFALVLATPLAGCLDKSPAQRIEAARQALQKHDAKAAIVELKSALQKESGNAEARLLLGEAFLTARQYPSSETELRKAMQLGAPADRVLPDLARTLFKRGKFREVIDLALPKSGLGSQALASVQAEKSNAYLALSQPAQAKAMVAEGEKVLAAVGGNAYSLDLQLAKVRLSIASKQPAQAMVLLDTALQHDAKSVDALYMKAQLQLAAGKTTEARALFLQILAAKPDEIPAHLALYDIALRARDLVAAEKALLAAERVDAQNLTVSYARGTFELQRGNLDKASSALLDVLRVIPNHLPSALAYAVVSYDQGHYDQSLKNAGIVLGTEPDNLIAVRLLASSQLKVGDIKAALKSLSLPLAKHPDDAKLLALAGEAYLQAKDYNKAMDYLDRASSLNPESADIKTSQATGQLAMGNAGAAQVALESATKLSNKPGKADLALVMLRMQLKQYDLALQAIAGLEKKLPNNPVTHNLRAGALLGKQDRAGARREFEQALAIQPGFFAAALNLARMDKQDNRPEAARKRFETILAVDKDNVKVMLALADLAAAENNERGYADWLEKAGKADPKALPIYAEAIVRHYLAVKENAKALALARQVVNANPENLAALDLLGATQLATGDSEAAITTYTRLIRLSPQSPDAYRLLAGAQVANTTAARDSLSTALRLGPDSLRTQDALIRLEVADNKPAAALNIAQQIQRQQPGSPLGFDREGDILLSQKRYPQAIKAYQEALAKGGGAADLMKLHRARFEAGDTKSADRQLSAWIAQHPEDRSVRIYAAEFYMLSNRDQEATSLYEELLKANPNDIIVLNNLATLYQREKDPRSLVTAEKAYILSPNQPSLQDTLGWILVGQNQLPRAIELLGRASAKAPRDALIRYHLGVALARAGKKPEAKRELDAAISYGRKSPELDDAQDLLKSL